MGTGGLVFCGPGDYRAPGTGQKPLEPEQAESRCGAAELTEGPQSSNADTGSRAGGLIGHLYLVLTEAGVSLNTGRCGFFYRP